MNKIDDVAELSFFRSQAQHYYEMALESNDQSYQELDDSPRQKFYTHDALIYMTLHELALKYVGR